MDLKMKNKYAFITASTSGIGLETAKAYLEEGAGVIINGRDKEKLDSQLASLKSMYPRADITGICMDLTKDSGIRGRTLSESFEAPSLDILVLNLGTGKRQNGDMCVEEWRRLFEINLFAAVNVINQLLDRMKENGGSIVFISSIAGIERLSSPYAYSASKLGVISLMKSLSCDLADYNIRVNCVAPGNIYFDGGRWQELISADPNLEENYIKKEVPLKRFGTPEEIADSVVFLSSERSSFTTGATLIVDGGQTRRVI